VKSNGSQPLNKDRPNASKAAFLFVSNFEIYCLQDITIGLTGIALIIDIFWTNHDTYHFYFNCDKFPFEIN